MVVLPVKFTILISWSPICIHLILLSTLMKLASTSATILYNSMESRHPWFINIKINFKFDCFHFRFDIGAFSFVNEFVPISEFTQNRKYKIDSKDITERFLFSSSVMSQIAERVCTAKLLFLISSDWCSPIKVANFFFCIQLVRVSINLQSKFKSESGL